MPDYFSLDIIPAAAETKLDIAPHDSFSNHSGFLSLKITTLTPIFISSGDVDLEGGQVCSCFAEVNGRPVIPGSSLKGVIRSIAEALSPSCLGGECNSKEKLCPACRIFGAPGYLGRVSVFDAALQDKSADPYEIISLEPSWQPVKVEGRKFYGSVPQIRKGDEAVKAVKPGVTFLGRVKFTNLEDWELGLLLLSMGLSPSYRFLVKIGGKKDKGLGTVRIDIVEGTYSIGRKFLEDSREAIDENKIEDMVLDYLLDWSEDHNVNKEIEKNRDRLMSYLELEGES